MEEKVDYIIVGNGFAAMFFAHQLIMNGKSFKVFSENRKGASHVSAGIINPVVLKKFTTFWKVQEQLDALKVTFSENQNYLKQQYLVNEPIKRIFHDEIEKLLWLKKATENLELSSYLDQNFSNTEIFINPFGTGTVMQSARLKVEDFFEAMFLFLKNNNSLIQEKFDYRILNPNENRYQNIIYRHIVFAEGMGVLQNPFFDSLPIISNKGHHLKVELSRKPVTDFIIKKKHFLFPIRDQLYYYGGTYDRHSILEKEDEKAVEQLINGLSEFYPYDFEVKEVCFGFRPTVPDRRPIIGANQEYGNIYVFNGLGTRGILNGNYFSKQLFEHIEYQKDIHPEVDVRRFQ